MDKSFKKDVILLTNILNNIDDIMSTMDELGCNTSDTKKSILYNKRASDLCMLYIVKIVEYTKLMTEDTVDCIKEEMEIEKLCKCVDSLSDDNTDRIKVMNCVKQIVRSNVIRVLKDRRVFCLQNKGGTA